MRGILDTSFIDLPVGLDLAYVEGLRMRNGTSFQEVLNSIDARLSQFNGTIDPFVASILSITTELYNEVAVPVAFDIEEAGEYTVARPQYAEKQPSPLLPLRKWDVSTEWTEDGLLSMSLSALNLQFDSLLLGMRLNFRKQVLKRLFSASEIRVDRKTTATNPGLAGSGTGTNVFSGNYPDGTAVPGGYTHYIREVAANRAASIIAIRDKILKWYPNAQVHLVGTQTFISAVTADTTNFVAAGSQLIRLPAGSAEALVDANLYLGVFATNILVHRTVITEVAGDYGLIYISFGDFDTRNVLAWRYDDLYGRDAFVRSRAMFPLDQAIVVHRYGIGVSNRVAAGIVQIAGSAGAYQDPTIA